MGQRNCPIALLAQAVSNKFEFLRLSVLSEYMRLCGTGCTACYLEVARGQSQCVEDCLRFEFVREWQIIRPAADMWWACTLENAVQGPLMVRTLLPRSRESLHPVLKSRVIAIGSEFTRKCFACSLNLSDVSLGVARWLKYLDVPLQS